MSYEAIVCRLANVRPHSNADRLKVADANGIPVLVGADHVDGELGIVFPEGGCIAREFCEANGLLKAQGGYLDENGRVRALKLRGEVSFGLWLPITSLSATTTLHAMVAGGRTRFEDGDRIGLPLCEKYITPATRRALAAGGVQAKKARAEQALAKHYDTPQLRDLREPPLGPESIAFITEKIHGTSGRTGLVEVEQPRSWWRRLLRLPAPKRWEYVSGTRNCLLDTGAPGEKGEAYRRQVHDRVVERAGLAQGEVWYYEIAGFDTNGTPIMASHTVGDLGDPKLSKALKKKYGTPVYYDYHCNPKGSPLPQHRVFVYRIVDNGRELTWPEVMERAAKAGFETPQLIVAAKVDAYGIDGIKELATTLTRDASFYSDAHPREGVCVRFESTGGAVSRAFKIKGFVFCALEGIARNDPNYLDAEEAA